MFFAFICKATIPSTRVRRKSVCAKVGRCAFKNLLTRVNSIAFHIKFTKLNFKLGQQGRLGELLKADAFKA